MEDCDPPRVFGLSLNACELSTSPAKKLYGYGFHCRLLKSRFLDFATSATAPDWRRHHLLHTVLLAMMSSRNLPIILKLFSILTFAYYYQNYSEIISSCLLRNGMERNETRSNWCTIQTWTLDTWLEISVDRRCLSVRTLFSCSVTATKTGQTPSRQHRATPRIWNILAVYYLVSSSGVADPSLTSEGSAMSLPSLRYGVGSGVSCGSPWNRKGIVSRCVLSTHAKQVSPQTARWHVNNPRARPVVGSPRRCITDI